jgi:uncharacterized phage infection (PIP) family protein YhgE
MDTAPNPTQTDSRRVLLDRADEELAHAYEQITRANEELARAEEQLSKLERAAVARKRPWLGGRAVRGFTGLMLAACIFVAAFVSHSSYRDTARQIVARWAPRLVATASPPLETPGLPAQPSPRTIQTAAVQTAPPQPAPLARLAPESVVPTAAALSPDLTQLIQSMARDLATLGQGFEQLKAGQEQMARDNANAAEQLKASQEQLARDNANVVEQLKASQEQLARAVAKASEVKPSEVKPSEAKASEAKASVQNLRPKISAPPLSPTATPTRRPVPTLPRGRKATTQRR